ncbi:hypothetical protein [Novipirellula artificiosorum]|nr:hypothetical protein [Novipirellula artificiosorum]
MQEQKQWFQQWLPDREDLTDEESRFQRKVDQLGLMTFVIYDQARDCGLNSLIRSETVLFEPGTPWPEAPLAKRIVDEAEPIIEIAEELLDEDADPLNGRGVKHWLQLDGETEGILTIYFQYSYYNRESDQAKRALVLLSKIAFNQITDVNSFSQRYQLQKYDKLYTLFSSTLSSDFWTDAQLAELSDQLLQPLDIPARLNASHKHRSENITQRIAQTFDLQADGIEDDFVDTRRTISVDSVYLSRLLKASRIDDGIHHAEDLVKSVGILSEAERGQPKVPFTGVFSVDVPFTRWNGDSLILEDATLAYELGALEDIRRANRLAVAIKRFEWREKRWPSSLEELAAEDEDLEIRTVEGHRIEYSLDHPGFGEKPAGWQRTEEPEDKERFPESKSTYAVVGNSQSVFLQQRVDSKRYYGASWLRQYHFSPLRIMIKGSR